jgi:hypothetical protein
VVCQQEYGDPSAGGVPVATGLGVGGALVGKDDFISDSAKRNVHTNVGGTFAAIAKIVKSAVFS